MKKIALFLVFCFVICFTGCSYQNKDVLPVYNIDATMTIWDEEEVQKAMDVVTEYFWTSDVYRKKCMLKELRYTQMEEERSHNNEWNEFVVDEKDVLVISVDFTTKRFVPTAGISPMNEYTYSCVLIKNNDVWQVESFGQP